MTPLDLVLIESGGDSLCTTFSSGLIDRQIFVIDVAGGERLPRKGGPGITSADLLVVNKTDLAPHVPVDLEVMRRDATARRAIAPGGVARDTPLPTLFTSLSEHPGAPAVADWIRELIVERRSAVARVKARARIVARAEEDGTTSLATLAGETPLLMRRAAHPDGLDTARIHLVGGTAGPIGGDDLAYRVDIGAGAKVEVRSIAAALALPGPGGAQSTLAFDVRIGPGARLDWAPEPLIAVRGANHAVHANLDLAEDAELTWREDVVLGREDEESGSVRSRIEDHARRPRRLRPRIRRRAPLPRLPRPRRHGRLPPRHADRRIRQGRAPPHDKAVVLGRRPPGSRAHL